MTAAALFGDVDGRGVLAAAFGALATVITVLLTLRLGATGLVVPLVLFVFGGLVVTFARWPHVAVAGTIVFFTLVPTLIDLVSPLAGATKDLITLAALSAACLLFVQRRAGRSPWPVDKPLVALVGLYVALYVVNIGGELSGESGHGAAWFHGVRLTCEPLGLFLVGLSLPGRERNVNWALRALIASGIMVALVGLVQQALGVNRLLELGYTYGEEVRQIGPYLRSSGTLGEPFSYAQFLLLTVAALLLWARMRWSTAFAVLLVAVALFASFVRTAAVILLAVVGIAIARRGHARFAALIVAASVVLAATVFVAVSQQRTTRSVFLSSTQYVTLSGRTSLWREHLAASHDAWIFGRGVGAVGTAASRAERSLRGRNEVNQTDSSSQVVDSGYFSVFLDVGAVGLAVLLAFFGRLGYLAVQSERRGERTGWLALGALAVIAIDPLTRESLTGFPVPWVAFFILGLAAAEWAARQQPRAGEHSVFAP